MFRSITEFLTILRLAMKWSHDYKGDVLHKGNNKITELRTILQRESQNT
jgi:hydroxymethylpyrimidine pyrophosphatase-like HAD family hydrolase